MQHDLLRITAGLIVCGWVATAFAQPGTEFFQRLDRNQDGRLTADEVPERLQERFQTLTTRLGREYITAEEFGEIFGPRAGQRPGIPGGTVEFLRRFDIDGDGKLSRDEIPPRLQERLGGLFDQLETDEIEIGRLAEQVERARRERRPDDAPRRGEGERPRRRLERPDGDRPQVGRPPFGRPPAEGRARDARGPERRRPEGRPPFTAGRPAFFHILDTDGNGRISKEEMLYVSRLFDILDRNGDGELDLSELMGFPGPDGERPVESTDRDRRGMQSPGFRPPFGRVAPEVRPDGSDRPEPGRPERRVGRGEESSRPERGVPDEESPLVRRAEAMFRLLDRDRDGVVTPEEWDRSSRLKPMFESAGVDLTEPMTREMFITHYVRISPGSIPTPRPEERRPDRESPPVRP